MASAGNMNKFSTLLFFAALLTLGALDGFGQSTSWTGVVSTTWRTAGNWTNGVPDATKDAIIGDASFVGANQPELKIGFGVGECKSLTIGNGVKVSILTESDGLYVYGNLLIGPNGTLDNDRGHLRVEGNWTNNGSYTAGSANRRVYFIGSNQTISGTSVTDFEKLYINSGSTVTLAQNIIVSNFLELNGTLDPTPNFFVTAGTNDINVRSGGVLKIKAATANGNYSANSIQITSSNATIDYASTTVNQVVDPSLSYEILHISGAMTKSLSANISVGRDLIINGGTLDLQSFTANRSSNGGNFSMANATTLRLGGTNTFPSNYSSILLAPTSTVEYYGGNQIVRALGYGHLTLSSSGGAISKTMPATAFSTAGNFTMTASSGTLSATAGNAIVVGGNVTLGASTTFNGSSFSHSFSGNWTNNGTYSVDVLCAGTLTSSGSGSVWSGSGVNNFANLIIAGNGTVVNLNTSISVCGNFSTTGGGTFTHSTGGTGVFTMTGTAKSISGSNIVFDDVNIASGSVTTASTFIVAGNLDVNGTLTASGGTLSLIGAGKSIGGAGALQFFALNVPGNISTARNLSIASNFSVAGTYAASAGNTTFNGSSNFSGTASLFDIQITGTASLTMGGSSTLRIAGTETLDVGYTFNATSNVPNTVNYNSSGAQSIALTSFYHLLVSGGNTKTALAGLTVNGNLTIGATTSLAAGSFAHSVGGNWINSGTFSAGTSTVQFIGSNDATLTGATTFIALVVNKSTANKLTLQNNVSATNVTMTGGLMLTGSNTITITATRTGSGIIIGRITRTHAFNTGINYAFEGPDNFINFSTVGTVTSVTVLVEKKIITGFPAGAPINRTYTIGVTGAAYTATLRLHYEQAEVNGNAEAAMTLWNDQGTSTWVNRLKSANDTGNNWVEQISLTDLANVWTLSDGQNVIAWTGLGLNTAWSNPANWISVSGSPGPIPTINDIAYLGTQLVGLQPTITTAAQAKKVVFGDVASVTLTLGSGGSLTVQGNIEGDWTSNRVHTIDVGSRTLTTFSDLELSKGVVNRRIDLTISTGSVSVNGSLHQTGGANITFTGNGTINVAKDYNYVSGGFTAGTGNVTYNGIDDQVIANHTYYNLNIEKVFGVASTNALLTVNGNLTLGTAGGQMALGATLNVVGHVTVAAGATLNAQSATLNVGGDWTLGGTFLPGTGTLVFNGSGPQNMTATTVNNIEVNKAGGTLTILGDLNVNGDINVAGGTVDVGTHNVLRTTTGGTATLGAGATARFAGSSLQIGNFAALVASPTSTIEFYGTSARPIPPISYGNLIFSNGGVNAKTMVGPTTVQGNLTINAGATLNAPASTLTVLGNIVSNGTFNTTNSTLILNGTSKTISGTITYNNVVVNGSYDLISGNATFNGSLQVGATGDFDLGGATVVSNGDLTNSGVLASSGVVTFSGTQVQTLQLINSVSSTSTGVINFNGTVSPVLNSNSSPVFATVNINNTSPIMPSQPWTVGVAMNIAAASTWTAGPFNHLILGNFSNAGTVTSSGTISFSPSTTANITLGNNFSSTGKIVFGGTGQINLSDNNQTFSSVDVLNTHASGITPATGWTLTDDLLIGPGATLKGGALTHTIGGGWTNNGTFAGNTSTVIFTSTAGVDELSGGGVNNFNHITFAAGSNLTIASSIFVARNFTNNGASLLFESSTVTFNGSASTVLGGTAVTDFEEMDVAKSGSFVQMNINASVSESLALTSGELRLNGNTMLISNPLVTSLTSAGGYIISENTSNNSRVNWVINNDFDAHVIPFGTSAGDLIPFTFVLTSGDGGTLSVATYGTGNDNLPLPPTVTELNDQFGVDNSLNTVDRFYQIDLIGATTPTANITFVASNAEVGTITSLQAQRWNGGWDAPLPGQVSGLNTVTVSGVTQFSPWAISGNSSPLPVTLVDFSAKQIGRRIALNWATASEIDNDHFEIEKSFDGNKFFVIGNVKGAINSTETRYYTFTDSEIKSGRIFYRLKQVDLDKKFTYSYIVTVHVGDVTPLDVSFHVFPNPVAEKIFIASEGLTNEVMGVTLFDLAGKVIWQQEMMLAHANSQMEVDATNLKPGSYIVQVISGGRSKSFRIVRTD